MTYQILDVRHLKRHQEVGSVRQVRVDVYLALTQPNRQILASLLNGVGVGVGSGVVPDSGGVA